MQCKINDPIIEKRGSSSSFLIHPSPGYYGGGEARPRSSRRSTVTETEITGNTKCDELTEGKESVGLID